VLVLVHSSTRTAPRPPGLIQLLSRPIRLVTQYGKDDLLKPILTQCIIAHHRLNIPNQPTPTYRREILLFSRPAARALYGSLLLSPMDHRWLSSVPRRRHLI